MKKKPGRARRQPPADPCAEKVKDVLLKHAHEMARIDRESRDRDWKLHERMNTLADEITRRVNTSVERQLGLFLAALDERLKKQDAR